MKILIIKITYILLFNLLIPSQEQFLLASKWENGYGNNSWYAKEKNEQLNDSLFHAALNSIEKNNLKEAITNLKKIISDSNSKLLKLNAHYSLAQIYLSHMSQYDLAISEFNQCLLSNYGHDDIKDESEVIKSFLELKQKATFMIGYIYHNHVGNYTKAQLFYQNFIMSYPNHQLVPSVQFELDILNEYKKVAKELKKK